MTGSGRVVFPFRGAFYRPSEILTMLKTDAAPKGGDMDEPFDTTVNENFGGIELRAHGTGFVCQNCGADSSPDNPLREDGRCQSCHDYPEG